MGVEAAEKWSPNKFFASFVRDVPAIEEILFAESEVNGVNLVVGLPQHEIGRLHIPIKVSFLVEFLDNL